MPLFTTYTTHGVRSSRPTAVYGTVCASGELRGPIAQYGGMWCGICCLLGAGGAGRGARARFGSWESFKLAKMLPIGPGGPQTGFSARRYVSRGFRKKIGSADSPPAAPRPPGAPPVLGSLVRRSADGLPSTRNWPFRWPLPPTSPPQVVPKGFRQKNIGSADSPPPRWHPGPGFLSAERGRAT
jgi:hypothetical protein